MADKVLVVPGVLSPADAIGKYVLKTKVCIGCYATLDSWGLLPISYHHHSCRYRAESPFKRRERLKNAKESRNSSGSEAVEG